MVHSLHTEKSQINPLTLFGKNSPKNFPNLRHSIVAPNSVWGTTYCFQSRSEWDV